jgi:hypothetical protein
MFFPIPDRAMRLMTGRIFASYLENKAKELELKKKSFSFMQVGAKVGKNQRHIKVCFPTK